MATVEDIQQALEENRPKVSKKDYTFFSVGFVDTLAKASVREGCVCKECCANTEKLLLLASTYPDLINAGEQGKRALEDGMDDVTAHLVKTHGYARGGWYKALYALVGFGIGVVVAAIAAFVAADAKTVVVAVLGVAMLAGYVAGAAKDRRIEQNHKKL